MRSASPEFDEVDLTDKSDEEDQEEGELSEEIPVISVQTKSPEQEVSNKDDGAVVFDDSESDEFSLPQVDWSCIDSPSDNTDGVQPLVHDEASADADGACLTAEPEFTNQYEVTDSVMMLNAKNAGKSNDYHVEASGGDTSISEGLIFNISTVGHHGAETALLHEGDKTIGESPVHSVSRLSCKRSRMSKDECEEQVQCKRLHHNIDDVLITPGSVAEAVLPRLIQDESGSDGVNLMPCYDNLYSGYNNESDSLSQSTSFATDTSVVSSGNGMSNMFSQDGDASFSQGTVEAVFEA